MIAGPLVVVLGFSFFHAALEARHLDPRAPSSVERAPNGDEDAEDHAQVANDRSYIFVVTTAIKRNGRGDYSVRNRNYTETGKDKICR